MTGPAASGDPARSGDPVVVERARPLAGLYARSLMARPRVGAGLDGSALVLPPAPVDPDRVAAYSRVCGFVQRDAVPLTYPHLLGFGLQVQLMVTRPFPFRLLGLVHLRQVVTQHRPLLLAEHPRVLVRAERLLPHAKGAVVDLVAEVDVDGEPVWSGRSTYLARGANAPVVRSGREAFSVVGHPGADDVDEAELLARASSPDSPRALWRVPADTGRRYAAVSGDVNPIHLHPWTARALGFPRAIAHGMWTAARVAAHLAPRTGPAAVLDVEFRRPVLLPSMVSCTTLRRERPPATTSNATTSPATTLNATTSNGTAVDGGWDLAVTDRAGGRIHLVGSLRPTAP